MSPLTVSTDGRSAVTRAASLVMAVLVLLMTLAVTRVGLTVSPWRLRQLAFHKAVSVMTRMRSHRALRGGAGAHGRVSSISSTAGLRGKAVSPKATQTCCSHVHVRRASGQSKNR